MSRAADLYLALCLIDAIEDGNLDAMRLLLGKHKANPNTILLEKDVAPMHLVVGADEMAFAEKATELMLQNGGDANLPTVDQKLTPLHAAASIGRAGVVRLLLNAGGNLEQLDEDERTPIQHAIEEGHYDVVRVMQDHVCRKKIERKRKQLLLEQQWCNNNNQSEIAMSSSLSPSVRPYKQTAYGGGGGFLPASHSTLSALQSLEERSFTPNKIHYNYDATSPYYVNITHRRKDRYKFQHSVSQVLFQSASSTTVVDEQENISPEKAAVVQQRYEKVEEDVLPSPPLFSNEEPSTVIPNRTNLFELTERNLENFTRNDESIGRRQSFIECWREKIADIRDRSSVSRRLDDIERILSSFSDSKANLMQTLVDEQVEETFVTATQEPPVPAAEQEDEIVIIQLSEEYLHTDDEAGVVFREKKMITAPPTFAIPAPPPPFPQRPPVPKVQVFSEGGNLLFTEPSAEAAPCVVNKNQSISSQLTVLTLPPLDYDTDALRAELTTYGEPPGPITKHTKKLYLRKLVKFRRHPERMAAAAATISKGFSESIPAYSVELMATVRKEEVFSKILDQQALELEMTSEFQSNTNTGGGGSATKPARSFREGHLKKSFIYLLLDPRISDNLPAQQKHLPRYELWRRFLSSIFYVGKGKSSRPYCHLYDAMKLFDRREFRAEDAPRNVAGSDDDQQKPTDGNLMVEEEQIIFQCSEEKNIIVNGQQQGEKLVRRCRQTKIVNRSQKVVAESQKLNRIIDVWCAGKGVVCLHVFHNIMPAEAYTREAAIIDAIGMQNLTNLKRGDYYGQSVSWPMKKRKQLGILLLYKAMLIFLAEGETQLLPSDLI